MDSNDVWNRKRKIEIQVEKGRDDLAHILEDSLYRDVLSVYAYGDARRGRELALAALETQSIPIKRVCG